MMNRLLITLTALVFLSACGNESSDVIITAEEYGDDWPYSVASGRLYCDPPGSAVVLESGGQVYALNGRAMGKARDRGYLIARDTIALRDSDGFLTIGSPSKIIRRGLDLCKEPTGYY